MFWAFAASLPPQNKERMSDTEPLSSDLRITREDLGRATWTLLHSVASYYPSVPSKRQQRDAKCFVDCLSRLYPCQTCSQHFQEIIKSNPPRVGSDKELQQWMCDVHNTVNRALKKPTFNCDFLQSRWGAVDCGPNGSCKINYKRKH